MHLQYLLTLPRHYKTAFHNQLTILSELGQVLLSESVLHRVHQIAALGAERNVDIPKQAE